MTVVWSARAVRHLVRLRAVIARDRPLAAGNVAATILASVDRLTRHPGLGRAGRVPGIRELVVQGTPYVIPYRVRCDRLEILGIIHGRRRWPEKLWPGARPGSGSRYRSLEIEWHA